MFTKMSFGYGGNVVLVLILLRLASAQTEEPNQTVETDYPEDFCTNDSYLKISTDEFEREAKNMWMPRVKYEVDITCRAYKKLINHYSHYLEICKTELYKFISEEYFKGIKRFTNLLCDNLSFQKAYLSHTECYDKIKKVCMECFAKYNEESERDTGMDEESWILRCCLKYKGYQCVYAESISKCDSTGAANLITLIQNLYDVPDKYNYRSCFPQKLFDQYCKQFNRAFSNSLYTPLFVFISIEFYLFNIF